VRTAVTTSATLAQRTIIAGRRSTSAFQTVRTASYLASPGRSNWPSSAELILTPAEAEVVMVLMRESPFRSLPTVSDPCPSDI
jgi:hypothetical protein